MDILTLFRVISACCIIFAIFLSSALINLDLEHPRITLVITVLLYIAFFVFTLLEYRMA
jgi:hypothetical protein